MFPQGELWSFEMYRPACKFVDLGDLPMVDFETGEAVKS
jgi:hypothetical protein